MPIVTKTFIPSDVYTPAELNRVNTNIGLVYAAFSASGYTLTPPYTLRTNYTSADWPYISDFNKSRACLKQMQDFLFTYYADFTGEISARKQAFGTTEANALERMVELLIAALTNTAMIWRISGTFYSGTDFAL
jgi:hypothetical protein